MGNGGGKVCNVYCGGGGLEVARCVVCVLWKSWLVCGHNCAFVSKTLVLELKFFRRGLIFGRGGKWDFFGGGGWFEDWM